MRPGTRLADVRTTLIKETQRQNKHEKQTSREVTTFALHDVDNNHTQANVSADILKTVHLADSLAALCRPHQKVSPAGGWSTLAVWADSLLQ